MRDLNNFGNASQESNELQKNIKEVEDTIDSRFKQLEDSKIDLSIFHSDCLRVMEQIGKISASNVKVKILSKQLEEEATFKIGKLFDEWVAQLKENLMISSEEWSSEYCPRKNRKKFVEDYLSEFNKSVSSLLNQWISQHLKDQILLYLDNMHEIICVEFEKLGALKLLSTNKFISISHNCKEKAKYRYSAFKQKQTYDDLSYGGNDNTKKINFIEGAKLVALDVAVTGLGAGVGTTVGFSAAVGGIMLGIGAGLVMPVIPISLITGTILGAKAITKNHSYELEKEIKTKIIETGYSEIKLMFSKVELNIMSWVNCEVFTGVNNCIENSFACVLSQYEDEFKILNLNIKISTAFNIEIEQKLAVLKDVTDKLKKLQHK